MKYFLTQTERRATRSSCFYEFQRGRFSGAHWLEDSLCISDECFDRLELYAMFSAAVKEFDGCGINIVRAEQWAELKRLAAEREDWRSVINELAPWAEDCLTLCGEFTVCGL